MFDPERMTIPQADSGDSPARNDPIEPLPDLRPENKENERVDMGKVLEHVMVANLREYPGFTEVRHGSDDEDRRLKKDIVATINTPGYRGDVRIDCSMTNDPEKLLKSAHTKRPADRHSFTWIRKRFCDCYRIRKWNKF